MGETNWLVPPPALIPAVLSKAVRERSDGTLVVPKWTSAPFWPVLSPGGKMADFVTDIRMFSKTDNIVSGRGTNKMFNDENVEFQMAAFRLQF